jgi:cellulose synthase (UDP-forming)
MNGRGDETVRFPSIQDPWLPPAQAEDGDTVLLPRMRAGAGERAVSRQRQGPGDHTVRLPPVRASAGERVVPLPRHCLSDHTVRLPPVRTGAGEMTIPTIASPRTWTVPRQQSQYGRPFAAPALPQFKRPAKRRWAVRTSGMLPVTDRQLAEEIAGLARVRRIRWAGLAVVACAAWYLPWLVSSANPAVPWLAWPFIVANVALVLAVMLSWINNWCRSAGPPIEVVAGAEPMVAVIIPTAGEPIAMLRRTLLSVLDQVWPDDKLCVLVGDDSLRVEVWALVDRLQWEYPTVRFLPYHPPPRGSADRRGDAKAGNLNEALKVLDAHHIAAEFIETRDADDMVGDPMFLRRTVAQLLADGRVAYAQTIKEALVAPGDPFGNNDPMFYRGSMFARHASNAVFPCGSGVVWRRRALEDIGDFPAWNLVEDLQSGIEALRRGWRGAYVPIIGAVGQTAPEDIPNVYKQRGTWAIDTVRLLVYGSMRGLTLRQRLQFLELGVFYFLSVANLICFVTPAVGLLLGTYPVVGTNAEYAAHFWPVTVAIEFFLITLNGRARWESLFRTRQMWAGLAPIFVVAIFKALVNGPNRKPVYKVTRKSHEYAWYWRATLPQALILVLLVAAIVKSVLTNSILQSLDLGSAYWATLGIILIGSFLSKSWFGLRRTRR